MALFKVFNYDVNGALLASFIYSVFSLILFIIVCAFGWKKVRENERKQEEAKKEADEAYEIQKKGGCKLILSWMKLVWKMKSIYLSALVHIYDIGTDVGIIVDWGLLANREFLGGPKDNVRGLDMRGLFGGSLLAFFLYRFISAGFVYQFTGKFSRACLQWFDLEIYRAIYITHKLGRDEAGNLQRWLQKFEAIFESAPQALLQLVYIVQTGDYHPLIISSIILSFFSVAARFTSDDKIFFNENAEGLGLQWRKRTQKKGKKVADDLLRGLSTSTVNREQTDHEIVVDLLDDAYDNETILTFAKQPTEIHDEDNWARWKIWNHIHVNRAYLFRYSFRMCDVFSRLMIMALIWCTLNGVIAFSILLFEVFTFVIYARRIGKYNFFQFLVATYFSEDDRYQTVSYCFIRRMESLIYLIAVSIVILFRSRYNDDSVVQCHSDYCNESTWLRYGDTLEFSASFPGTCSYSASRSLCELATNYDRDICDCGLEEEVLMTKILLIAAWAFGNLSGSVFFGAFHSMRQKFGTNERNIVNVMQKRDWEAFSEMLQFGYRMDRFDHKSNRSALSTFLDRVPSDKFEVKDVHLMIKLGADINDRSVNPENEDDQPQPDKIGDNVLIRYIKVTPCEVIDKEFEDVVTKWSRDGIKQNGSSRVLTVDINATNNLGYTPFKIYWEKMQYLRRSRLSKRRKIQYIKTCRRIDAENPHHNAKMIRRAEKTDRSEQENEQWFKTFYVNILKWKELGADMSTMSEDRMTPLLAYIQDTQIRDYAKESEHMDQDDTQYIEMDFVKRLCPVSDPNDDEIIYDKEECDEKYPHEDYLKTLTLQIKRKAFATWINKYDQKKAMFKVSDIAIWHGLGCTDQIHKMNLLSVYLMRYASTKHTTDYKSDIDSLIECGCTPENEKITNYPSRNPVPMSNVINNAYLQRPHKAKLFDDALGRWYIRHGLEYYDESGSGKLFRYIQKSQKCPNRVAITYALRYSKVVDLPHWYLYVKEIIQYDENPNEVLRECWDVAQVTDTRIDPEILAYIQEKCNLESERNDIVVHDIDYYTTRLQHMVQAQTSLSLDDIKRLRKAGYLIAFAGAKVQKILRRATTNPQLRFDVFTYLLDEVITQMKKEQEDKDEKVEDEEWIELDFEIFNQWIQRNKHITFEAIETLIGKYHFSPYLSDSDVECSIHCIWKNIDVPLDVIHRFWIKYGQPKFGKFKHVYQAFLFDVIERRNLTMAEIKYLETIFQDEFETSDKESGNHIIHYYCNNVHVNMEILTYLCTHYRDLLDQRNKEDHHALHLLCQNKFLKTEFLQYFVVELGIPMDIRTHVGWQPWQALHHFVDNKRVIWDQQDMKIMIAHLNINWMTIKAGEFILFRLSHQNNFTTEALIYLYKHYKEHHPDVDLRSLKSQKRMYSDDAVGGGKTILANLVSRELDITPNQIRTLVKDIGFDITAKDGENRSVLHFACNKYLTAPKLNVIATMLRDEQKDQFLVDLPDRTGTTPFQQWLRAIGRNVGQLMDIVEVWEELGSDITQLDNSSSFNMLHYYLKNDPWNIQLSHIRKMCFDAENPWKSQEKKLKHRTESKERVAGKYQMPMHVRPIPDNETLAQLYTTTASKQNQQINIEVLRYFKSKKEIRFDLTAPNSALWCYLQTSDVNVGVLKVLIEEMKFSIKPQPKDNIALQYMKYQSKRDKIIWDVLDYFYKNENVDFTDKQEDYVTILHLYAEHSRPFVCDDFHQLIQKYDLKGILTTATTDPTAAGVFYKLRRRHIRPDIIECFTSLEYDIHEAVNNMTPIHYYCQMTAGHYVLPSIVKSFIQHGADIHNTFIDKTFNSVCQIIANARIREREQYDQLKIMEIMMDEFDVRLKAPRKRKHGIWYNFMKFYDEKPHNWAKCFKKFESLIKIYIKAKEEPKQLLHDDKMDGKKKIKYKIYLVNDNETEEALHSPKNRKAVVDATQYVGRIVFVTDDRDLDSVFRSCKPIDPRSDKDLHAKIPQIWLVPIKWTQLMEQMHCLAISDRKFQKSLKLAKSNFFIDLNLVKKIASLHSTPEMINDISVPNDENDDENLLLKYLRCNHESQIFAKDIKVFADLKLDFKFGYAECSTALFRYCLNSEGVINGSIVDALCDGGCPINWDYEPNQDGNGKGEVIKTACTPLIIYASVPEANLESFHTLVKCGSDVTIEHYSLLSAVYLLLGRCENLTPAFIEFLAKDCEYNFDQPLIIEQASQDDHEVDTMLFNVYLRGNEHISKETIRALVNHGHCDPNSRDDRTDTNSIKAYIQNENIKEFNMEIIRVLVELGANINEPDNEGVYPVQHLLLMKYTPLEQLMPHVRGMIELGAKLEHILCDDDTAIDDHRLYVLQQMKDGYEHYNDSWCTIKTRIGINKNNNAQLAVALNESESNQTLYINIRRSNLIDITKEHLFEKYPALKGVKNIMSDEDDEQQGAFSEDEDGGDSNECKEEEEN
eukprot:1165992_1